MKDDDLVRLLHGRGNRFAIERRNRAQVDNFELDSFFAQNFRGFERRVQHGRVRDHAQIAAFAGYPRLAERDV